MFDVVVMNCTEDFQAPTLCEFSCRKQESSAFKSFIVTYCLKIFYFSESFRRISSEVDEVEVDYLS